MCSAPPRDYNNVTLISYQSSLLASRFSTMYPTMFVFPESLGSSHFSEAEFPITSTSLTWRGFDGMSVKTHGGGLIKQTRGLQRVPTDKKYK